MFSEKREIIPEKWGRGHKQKRGGAYERELIERKTCKRWEREEREREYGKMRETQRK